MFRNDAAMSMSNDEVIFYVAELKENFVDLLQALQFIFESDDERWQRGREGGNNRDEEKHSFRQTKVSQTWATLIKYQ